MYPATITANELESLIQEKCCISTVRPFQISCSLNLIKGEDLFLVVAPGMGKTVVMSAPLLVAQRNGENGIAIVVVPSKILTEQQARAFNACGIRALAINEDTQRDAFYRQRNLVKELSSGTDVRAAVVTPWMVKNERLQDILSSGPARAQLRWLFVDEVHLANKKDPSVWLEAYTALIHLRARLPSRVIWGAFTGTATSLEARDIALSLGFRPGHYVMARYTVDRANVKYIPRFLEHPVSGATFLDLSFLVPFSATSPGDIPSTLVFCDTIELGYRVINFLDSLLPVHMPNRSRLIMPCNALMDLVDRDKFKAGMDSGSIRIGVVTDTCTYGFNIQATRVVTFCTSSVPAYSKLMQQWGRVSRDGSPGVVYAFVPSWVRDVPFFEVKSKQQKEDQARREKLPKVIVEWFNATEMRCPRQVHLAFNDQPFVRPHPCCSLHDPEPERDLNGAMVLRWKEHLEKLAGGAVKERLPRTDGTHCRLEPHMKASVSRVLDHWRIRRWATLCSDDADEPANAFISDELLTRLGDKLHICTTYERFSRVVGSWDHLNEHGRDLFAYVTEILSGFDEIFLARDAVVDAGESEELAELHSKATSSSQVSQQAGKDTDAMQLVKAERTSVSASNISSVAPRDNDHLVLPNYPQVLPPHTDADSGPSLQVATTSSKKLPRVLLRVAKREGDSSSSTGFTEVEDDGGMHCPSNVKKRRKGEKRATVSKASSKENKSPDD
ncbi:P-loop containing nucleoside triphosphate hydrolase protein [Trametes cingulata]|nr:P-loop containing nucleoside triphosphate hydrolase protein [Trametes cingulata]